MKQELLYKEQGFATLKQWVWKYWNWLSNNPKPLNRYKENRSIDYIRVFSKRSKIRSAKLLTKKKKAKILGKSIPLNRCEMFTNLWRSKETKVRNLASSLGPPACSQFEAEPGDRAQEGPPPSLRRLGSVSLRPLSPGLGACPPLAAPGGPNTVSSQGASWGCLQRGWVSASAPVFPLPFPAPCWSLLDPGSSLSWVKWEWRWQQDLEIPAPFPAPGSHCSSADEAQTNWTPAGTPRPSSSRSAHPRVSDAGKQRWFIQHTTTGRVEDIIPWKASSCFSLPSPLLPGSVPPVAMQDS